MVQNRPTNASEIKAPSKGVKLAVPPKLVRVLAALVTGICSCVVKYLIILVLNPTTANFSQISFATHTHTQKNSSSKLVYPHKTKEAKEKIKFVV